MLTKGCFKNIILYVEGMIVFVSVCLAVCTAVNTVILHTVW